jgi:endo-1,3(4)-beta-glucanase
VSNSRVEASCPYAGFIQVAKVAKDSASTETVYDASAGVYPVGMTLTGHAGGMEGFYYFRWTKAGVDTYRRPLVMFALPHHGESFDAATSKRTTALQLQTTTKGIATAVLSDSWTLTENKMPTKMGFEPWSPTLGSCASLTQGAIAKITEAAAEELRQDMDAQTNLDSMYFSGKVRVSMAIEFAAPTANSSSGSEQVCDADLHRPYAGEKPEACAGRTREVEEGLCGFRSEQAEKRSSV